LDVRNIVGGPNIVYTYMEHLATLGKIPFIIIIIIIMSMCLPCKLKDFFRTPTKQKQH